MNAPITPPPAVPPYHHTPLFPLGPDKTPYRKLEVGGVTVEKVMGKDMLVVGPRRCARWPRPPSPTSIICCARRT